MAPGAVPAAHHHGEAETFIYIIDGSARFMVGPRLDETMDAEAGDFLWVPPNEIHVEVNRSPSQPLRMVVARTPEDIAVDVPAPDAAAHS